MKTTITDSRLLDLSHEQAEITLKFFKEEEQEQTQIWETLLGLVWTKDMVSVVAGGESSESEVSSMPISTIRYPLSLILKPELMTELRLRFGFDSEGKTKESNQNTGDTYVDTTVTKKEFLKKMHFNSKLNFDDENYFPISDNLGKKEHTYVQRKNPIRLGDK
jgi:hypothetical protein